MVENIIPAPNPTITIQPLTTAVGSQDSASLALQNLPIGTLVEGFVVNRDAQQNPILRTSLGDVLVKSDIFLKTGSEVVFRIDPSVNSRARILTIDGMNPQDYAARVSPNLGTALTDQILTSSLLPEAKPIPTNPQIAVPQPATVIPALLVSTNVVMTEAMPPEVAQYWTQIVSSLQKDTALMFKIVATELPLPGDTPLPTTATQAGPISIIPKSQAPLSGEKISDTAVIKTQAALLDAPAISTQQTPPTPAAVPTAPQLQPVVTRPEIVSQQALSQPTQAPAPTTAQTTATVTFSNTSAAPSVAKPIEPQIARAVTVPATTSSITPQLSSPPMPHVSTHPHMVAHVIGHEFDSANIIQTPVGTFKLLTAHPLPTGTKLTLEVTTDSATPLPSGTAPLLPTDLEEFTHIARDWTSLREAVTAIAGHDPALAQTIITNILPKPHAKMTAEMLFLFSAIKSGTPEQWFGKKAIELLDLRSPEILKRLQRDFTQLQQSFSEALPQWTSVIMPFYSEAQLQHIRMFFRHEDESGKKSSDGSGQRFIIEVDLSHLGDMQLDGFIKRDSQRKQFDLVIRSARALPLEIEQNIRQIFDNSLQATGYKGYVNFQQGIHLFVRPLEHIKEAMTQHGNTLLV